MKLDPFIDDPDAFYAALVAANEGLAEEQSNHLILRLVFLLANQVGDAAVINACVAEAAKFLEMETAR
ncbi:DUF2783 domain-containing protein [Nitratireductor soli]|uniref:DUF2783 domain-containing protein n=1 Tax=Nitratireductor soli TaxID=1670619 RepID=UPI00065E8AF9|nr:DUF2783 domain-containing protein [Nitratireductor soli]